MVESRPSGAGAVAERAATETAAQSRRPVGRPTRLDALTGLRFVAAFAVYLNHTPVPAGLPVYAANVMGAGSAGVTVFFVLSGFVLAHTYFEALRRPSVGRLWGYAVARIARIYPLYWLVLASVIAFDPRGLVATTDGWVEHALGLQAWGPGPSFSQGFNGAAWSVSVELFLYATLPLLIPLVARLDRGTAPLAALGAATVGTIGFLSIAFWLSGNADLPRWDPSSAYRWLYIHPVPRLGDFVFGIVLARLYRRLDGRPGARRVGSVGAIAVLILMVAVMALKLDGLQPFRYDATYLVLGGLLILALAIAPRGPLARLLAWAPIAFLGEISYALYLIHWSWMYRLGAGAWQLSGGALVGLAWEVATLALVLGVACAAHLAVERPLRDLIRRLLVPPRLFGGGGLRLGVRPSGLGLATVRSRWPRERPVDPAVERQQTP